MSDTGAERGRAMTDGAMDGTVAIVTGASQGIGEAVARRFAEEGARLVISDLTGEVHAVAESIARQFSASGVVGVVTDVTDPAACDVLVAEAVGRHGSLGVLAHATAILQRKGPTVDLEPEE